MQIIVRLLIAAAVLLILKAMFLDDYIKQYQSESNVSSEVNATTQGTSALSQTSSPRNTEVNTSERREINASQIHSREDFEKASEQGLFDRFVDWLADKLSKKVPPPAEL